MYIPEIIMALKCLKKQTFVRRGDIVSTTCYTEGKWSFQKLEHCIHNYCMFMITQQLVIPIIFKHYMEIFCFYRGGGGIIYFIKCVGKAWG